MYIDLWDLVVTALIVLVAGALMMAGRATARAIGSEVRLLRDALDEARRRPEPPASSLAYQTLPADEEEVSSQASRVHLPVVLQRKICSDCANFDLKAGQHLIEANPAFSAATRALPPWRMGRVLKQKPNPRRAELIRDRQVILDAIAEQGGTSTDEQTRALAGIDREIVNTPDTIPAPDAEQVSPELLAARWTDLGACTHHEELRLTIDTCDAWRPR